MAKKSKQSEVTEFFGKAGPSKKPTVRKISKSMKPASPPKAKKRVVAESDDEDYDSVPKAPPVRAAGRAARGAVKKYVEILSDDEGSESLFVDDD